MLVTDFVQFVVMMIAVVVLVPLVLGQTGGLAGFFDDMPKETWAPTSGDYTWRWLVPFFMVMVFSYSTRWSVVQRYYAVGTDKDARRVGYLLAALTFVITPLIFMPAMAARIYMPDVADANDVYMLVCKGLLPVGMLGMVIAAMFSATMSMLSSDYNAAASVLTNDVYKRFIAPEASDRSLVFAGRVATFAIGAIALGIALVLARAGSGQDLVKIMAKLFSVLLPPVAIPMLCGLLTRKVSNAGGLGGFVAGTVCGVTAYGLSYVEGYEHLRSIPYLPWITSLPTLGVTCMLSALMPDCAERRERVGRFLDGLESAEHEPASGGREAARTALAVIGLSGAAMGALLLGAVIVTGAARDAGLSLVTGALMVAAGVVTAFFASMPKAAP